MLKRLYDDAGTSEQPSIQTHKTLPLQRLGSAEEMAKTICFVLSDDSSFTTGQTFSADGGIAC